MSELGSGALARPTGEGDPSAGSRTPRRAAPDSVAGLLLAALPGAIWERVLRCLGDPGAVSRAAVALLSGQLMRTGPLAEARYANPDTRSSRCRR